MELFVCLCGILCFFGVLTVSKKRISRKETIKFFVFISFACLLIISGCRALDVGTDTPMFVRYFEKLKGFESMGIQSGRFEIGFRFFCCLIAHFFTDAHAMLFLSAFLTLVLLYLAFWSASENAVYSILMFIALNYYYNSMCLTRQYIAVALCCLGITFLMQKKRVAFVVLVVLGGLFHTTAFLVLFLLLFSILPYRKNQRYWYLLLGVLCTIGFSGLVTVFIRLLPGYEVYLYSENFYLVGKLGSIIRAVISGLLYLLYNILYTRYGDNSEASKISFFTGMFAFFITLVSVQGAILSRIATYFNIFFCISIPNALSWLPDRNRKYLVATSVLIGSFAYSFWILAFRPEWAGILPYHFWNA